MYFVDGRLQAAHSRTLCASFNALLRNPLHPLPTNLAGIVIRGWPGNFFHLTKRAACVRLRLIIVQHIASCANARLLTREIGRVCGDSIDDEVCQALCILT